MYFRLLVNKLKLHITTKHLTSQTAYSPPIAEPVVHASAPPMYLCMMLDDFEEYTENLDRYFTAAYPSSHHSQPYCPPPQIKSFKIIFAAVFTENLNR